MSDTPITTVFVADSYKIAVLEAENARLRRALEQIADPRESYRQCREIARAALRGEG